MPELVDIFSSVPSWYCGQDLDGRRAALSAQLEELERAAASVEPRQAQLRMLQDQNKERRQRFAVGWGEGERGVTE